MKARLQQFRHELGWQGMSGILLLLLGLLISDTVLAPQEQRAAAMRDRVEAQNPRSSMSAELQRDVLRSPADMLDKFYGFFVDDQEITDHLAKIYNLAQANGLVLLQGDYKVVRDKNVRMTQYQISLPVTGSYNQIRGFAAHLLDKVPVISLDQIKFERKHPNSPTIEAQIMITLYLVRP